VTLQEYARKVLIIPLIVLGLLVFWFMTATRKPAVRARVGEEGRRVRIIHVPLVAVVPRTLGYGEAQPGAVWRAVAEVSGKVVMTSERLKKGELVPKETLLIRIDPTEYELAVAQAEASITSIEAQMRELDANEANTRASLLIEEKALEVSKKELERKRRLVRTNSIAQSVFDQEERSYFAQENRVQALKNELNLLPAKRQVLAAQLAVEHARLDSAKLNLKYTEIRTPFDGRIAEVHVEETQFVQRGQVLAVAESMAVTEVPAQVPIQKLLRVMGRGSSNGAGPGVDFPSLIDRAGLSAVVRVRAGNTMLEWPARVARIDSVIDRQTRTVGVIVAVDDPYEGQRTPLQTGYYCEVELRGRPRPESLVIPRSALHLTSDETWVYLVDAENRLERRDVTLDYTQGDLAVVARGLRADDKVVISDVVPAISGMLLVPERDGRAETSLLASATGRTPVE
jgi:RND family efflux transporter MFP subunit